MQVAESASIYYRICSSGKALRPVLPHRPCARPGGRALVAARGSRARARAAPLHRRGAAPRLLDQHPRRAPQGASRPAAFVRRRQLPPPAASTVYELTGCGVALRPVLRALAWWGAETLGPPPPDEVDAFEPGWLAQALFTAVEPGRHDGVIEFRVGDEVAHLEDGDAVEGPAGAPDVDRDDRFRRLLPSLRRSRRERRAESRGTARCWPPSWPHFLPEPLQLVCKGCGSASADPSPPPGGEAWLKGVRFRGRNARPGLEVSVRSRGTLWPLDAPAGAQRGARGRYHAGLV